MLNENMLLPLMVFLPLLGGVALMLLPDRGASSVRMFALLNTTMTLGTALGAAAVFNWTGTDASMQMTSQMPWIEPFGLSFRFGVDAISLWLVLLSAFLMPLVVLGSFCAVKKRYKEFFAWLLVLEAAMIGTFVATDVIFFYICFEFTLIPLYFLIGVFGSTQRLKAARVFFLYTFTGSMLTLVGVLYVAWSYASNHDGVWSFSIPQLVDAAQQMEPSTQMWVLLALLAGFSVKVPLFPVHTWLPLAHTEAPTAGSVILAGVLLKLGTYGLLRFALPMCPVAVVEAAPAIGVLAVIGILYTALICWVQQDIKKLIAYSSVSHLGFCVLGMFSLNDLGVSGSVMYMINHGLSTGALFLCVGMIYERFHTRQMKQMGGLGRVMPRWAFFMVFFCLCSIGLPGLNGFVGEFLTLLGTFQAQEVLGIEYAIPAGFGMIFSAIYLLYMVGRVVFGPVLIPRDPTGHERPAPQAETVEPPPQVKDLNLREIATLVPLAIACLWLGLAPNTILSTLKGPIDALIAAPQYEATRRAATQDVLTLRTTVGGGRSPLATRNSKVEPATRTHASVSPIVSDRRRVHGPENREHSTAANR